VSDQEGQSLETQAEEASKDANVTIDEPTAPALDTQQDPNTEWEKAAAEQTEDKSADDSASDDDNSDESQEKQEGGTDEDEDDSGQS
jgi:hypothetical protein